MGILNVYEVRYVRDGKDSEYTISVMASTPAEAVVDAQRHLKASIAWDAEIIGVNRRVKNVVYFKTPAAKPRKR